MLKRNVFLSFAVIVLLLTVGKKMDAQQMTSNSKLLVQTQAVTGIFNQQPANPFYKRKFSERSLRMQPLPTTVINSREIENTGYSNIDFFEIIKTVPGTNVNISRESTINLRGFGTAKTMVLMDGKKQEPVYGQSVIYDLNNIPVSAIERLEVLKDGSSAIYGSDAVSGVVNFITKQEIQPRITANNTYDAFYEYPSFDFGALSNNRFSDWSKGLQATFSAAPGLTTFPDRTYGRGGSVQSDLKIEGDFRVQELKFFDENGKVRKWTHYEIYPENYRFDETLYYDCSGSILHYSSGFTDKYGFDYSLIERAYENNQPVAEYRDIWPTNNGNRLRLNLLPLVTTTERFNNYWSNYNFEIPKEACPTNGTPACSKNILFGGFSVVFEDFGANQDRLKMPGGFINYTRMFSQNLGVTAHLSYNSAERHMVDYSKLGFYGGISYTPFEKANCDDGFIFNAQALLGLVNQQQKFNNNKYSDTYLTGMFGFTQALKLSDNIAVRATEHYTPTFSDGNTAHNFTFGLGVRLNF